MNKNNLKSLFPVLLMVCVCLSLCGCGGDDDGYHYRYKEEEIIAFVQEHEEEIRAQIEAAGEETIKEFDGIQDVSDRRKSNGLVYYEYIASGLMTSSLQAGFYYSIDDTPSFYGGASWAWAGGYGWSEVETEEENLWKCQEDGGDNYLVTRKICDNFYYVVAGN